MLTIGTVVLGVEDLNGAMRFWRGALGYEPRGEPESDWVVLVPVRGHGTHLALMHSTTPAEEHPRIHLDLYTDEQEAEVERLIGLGGQRVEWDRYPPDPDFVVLADPCGNRFCVVDTTHG